MLHQANHLFIAAMDIEAENEAFFHDVYDNEHIPFIREVPGVLSVARFQRQELTVIVGGERRTIHIENEPKYAAFYELESPEVLTSEAWADAVERGRWAGQVRPFTKNRRHTLMKLIQPKQC